MYVSPEQIPLPDVEQDVIETVIPPTPWNIQLAVFCWAELVLVAEKASQ